MSAFPNQYGRPPGGHGGELSIRGRVVPGSTDCEGASSRRAVVVSNEVGDVVEAHSEGGAPANRWLHLRPLGVEDIRSCFPALKFGFRKPRRVAAACFTQALAR